MQVMGEPQRGFGGWVALVLVLHSGFTLGNFAAANEPLHQRIDKLVEAGQFGPTAGLASDSEFLRRTHLTLAGSAPSIDETRIFLNNPDPTKRTALIDRLLNSPSYARWMATYWDVLLMERRPDQAVS